jgi:N-acetylmuramoyl-L-alanine amidase
LHEKHLTLKMARLVAGALRRLRPGLRVRLTRDRDRYLTLQQRGVLANRWKADLFVSIHFNASESRSQRGYETFVLAGAAADYEVRRLARQRPAGEATVDGPAADLATILAELRLTAAHRRSGYLARQIQQALATVRGKPHHRGVQQATFDVLLGLRMPGVLVEAGFIDHPVEGPELAHPATQHQIAEAIARGIARFLEDPS